MITAVSTEGQPSATDAVVEFVTRTVPSASALEEATAQLERFWRDAQAGSDGAVVRALERVLTATERPIAQAWIIGAAAASGGGSSRWVAVCAAVGALDVEARQAPAATAVGYAVADSVVRAIGASHPAAGWSVPATAGAIGAVAAASFVLGLQRDRLRHAIGICATQAAGLRNVERTDAGSLQLGKAASNAVEAALLARNGFTCGADLLGGRRGMFALMSVDAQPQMVAAALDRAWF